MNTATARNALTILKGIQSRNAEWEAEAEQYAREGYRPQHCRHGVNLWANDWDCACGACEDDGFYPDAEADRRNAIKWAKEFDRKVADLIAAGAAFKASLSDPVAVTGVWDLVILEVTALKKSYGL